MYGRTLFRFLSLFCLLAILSPTQAQEIDMAQGESLFKANCASCHHPVKNLTGPALGGALAKYASDKDWVYSWVKNAPALKESGDAKAVALSATYPGQMSAFPTLQDAQIDNILAYAEAESLAITAPKEPTGDGTEVASGGGDLDPTVYYALLGLIGVLVLIALLLVVITATLITAVRAKDGEEPFTAKDVMTRTRNILKNKFVATALASFILVAGGAKLIAEARQVSLHEGYMPEQPIKFSHKLHAGENQIECQYCHTGTLKSKSAWIPSANVCMNCHKYIQEGPEYGTEEISKIYKAIGFDPEKGQYIPDYEQQPIEWVRIHNLPDHAYFNHAQHVVVGNQECQTCHGPIEEMEVVYQYSSLGMGWCINCHREEKVKSLGKDNDLGLTVEDMGGLNCARCHY
ncbi:MAG: cytochrome c3 family protein [Bacteroidota bacterium]